MCEIKELSYNFGDLYLHVKTEIILLTEQSARGSRELMCVHVITEDFIFNNHKI